MWGWSWVEDDDIRARRVALGRIGKSDFRDALKWIQQMLSKQSQRIDVIWNSNLFSNRLGGYVWKVQRKCDNIVTAICHRLL
jgi:hypothetical protein